MKTALVVFVTALVGSLAVVTDAGRLVRVRRLVETGAARVIRETAGLSLSELADAARVHRLTIYRWEHRQRRPHGEPALRYLAVLEELSA